MSGEAPYASDPAKSRGRVHPASESPTRSEFQRDRDRIIHSAAFRRLQYKTQVFLRHEGQHFRTRLTHTLEVSQMARSIARALRLNEDLAEAIALAHDLGHPPFGHAGERVLQEKMQPWGGFDHNMQAIRVVTILENRYADHDGLNLAWETLEGILKHNGPLLDADGQPVGRYVHEGLPFGVFNIPASADLLLASFASLEAQAAAIADDMAYNAHDIDDALRAKLLSPTDMLDVPLVSPIVRDVLQRWPGIEPRRQAHEIQRGLITRVMEEAIITSEDEIASVGPSSPDDAREASHGLIHLSDATGEAAAALQAFLFERVYRSNQVMDPVQRGQEIVGGLFDRYFDSGDLPGRWREGVRAAPDDRTRARLVTDFVAGMTDPYAEDEYARLFDGRRPLG